MGKRIWLVFVIIVYILTAGCGLIPTTLPQATQVGISDAEIATLSAFATQANLPPISEIPDPASLTSTAQQGGELPTITNTPESEQATKTPLPGSIKITAITQKSSGIAQITWEATGDFPSGFKGCLY